MTYLLHVLLLLVLLLLLHAADGLVHLREAGHLEGSISEEQKRVWCLLFD